MYDQVLDNFRRAAESTMHIQQEMFKNWSQQWLKMPGMMDPSSVSWVDQFRAFHLQWNHAITDMLTKHREALDNQYRAGIRAIEEASKLAEAKEPEQFRKLMEELWRHSYDCLKTLTETQLRDFQAAAEKWLEVASKGADMAKPHA